MVEDGLDSPALPFLYKSSNSPKPYKNTNALLLENADSTS
jgi:hypothetical protein